MESKAVLGLSFSSSTGCNSPQPWLRHGSSFRKKFWLGCWREKCCFLLRSDYLGGFWSDREKRKRKHSHQSDPDLHIFARLSQGMQPCNPIAIIFWVTWVLCKTSKRSGKNLINPMPFGALRILHPPHVDSGDALWGLSKGRKAKCLRQPGTGTVFPSSSTWRKQTCPSFCCYHWQLHHWHLGGKMGVKSAFPAQSKSLIICILKNFCSNTL